MYIMGIYIYVSKSSYLSLSENAGCPPQVAIFGNVIIPQIETIPSGYVNSLLLKMAY